MYVWFDALINYISALGWPQDKKKFQRWWPGIQVAGKDNLRQQTAIWQAMLMSAGLPNTRQVLIHGFITANGRKMSKSLGNVINPFALVKKYGTDPLRYYLLKEIPPTKDGDFTEKHFQEVYNADLANGLGNLIQRVAVLCQNLPPNLIIGMRSHLSYKIFLNKKKRKKYRYFLENYQFNRALAWIWKKAASLDKYINQVKPWEKKGKELEEVLTKPIKEILTISLLLKPFLPETSKKIKLIFEDKKVKAPTKPLFPRVK